MLRLDGRAARKTSQAEATAFADDVLKLLPRKHAPKMPEPVVHELLLGDRTYGVKPIGFHKHVVSFGDAGPGEVLLDGGYNGVGEVCVSDSSPVAETAALWDRFVDDMGW